MAGVKPAAKILRVLGPKDDGAWERALIGIYDYLDGLTTVAFRQSVVIETPIADVAAYTTLQTVGLGTFPKRRVANFSGVFLITDNIANARSDIDIGLFGPFTKGLVPLSSGHATDFLRGDGTWAAGGGSGITQLTGDGTAGPGSGSQVFTNVNAPSGFTHAGTVVTTAIAAPALPAAGKAVQWVDSTSKNFCSMNDVGAVNHGIRTFGPVASNWLRAVSDAGVPTLSRPDFTDITGTVGSGQWGPLTGDVTTSGYVATLANIPTATPAAGSIIFTAIAAPSSPASGKGTVYVDSTSKNIAVKNDAGTVNHGIQTRAAVASNWIRSIADDGSSTISQPAFTDLTGSATLAQLGSGAALSVLGQPANSAGTRSDIAASASSGQALRESGGTIGWGTLATPAYGAASVTYPKIQSTGSGSVILGSGSGGSGTIQELTVTGPAVFTVSTLKIKTEYSLLFGGYNIQPGTLGAASFYIGLGSFEFSTSSLGFKVPGVSSNQDWGVTVNLNSLVASGATTVSVQAVINGTPFATLLSLAIGATGSAVVSSSQAMSAGDVIGIRISVNSGLISSGGFGIMVAGRFQE